jgi:hypothetical protein
VTSWGEGGKGPTVVRLKSSGLGLDQLFPGVPSREAYGRFLEHVLRCSGASVLSDKAALDSGQYPRFSDAKAMEKALYGS